MERNQDIEAWRMFLAVAKAGSISGACDECMADASQISRTIFALEKSLGGIRLLDRRTRPFGLTENGKIALEYARAIVRNHDELMSSIEKDFEALRGPIRVGLPPILQIMMRDFLIDFIRRYPEISLSVIEYRGTPAPIRFDGPQGKFDIITGYGPDPTHDNIVQIHYGDTCLIPCASPEYLKLHGRPEHPSELYRHRGILYGGRTKRILIRSLSNGDESVTLQFGRESFFNSGYTAIGAAIGGTGIHPGIPAIYCAKEIAAGRLVPVFPGWQAPRLRLYIFTKPELVKFRRVRVFIDEYRRYLSGVLEETARLLKGKIPDVMLEPMEGTMPDASTWGEEEADDVPDERSPA